MKYAILCSLLAISFFSCVKEPVTVPPLAQDSVLVGYTLYSPITKTKIIEGIGYNLSKQLTTITSATYDTSSGSPIWDSLSLTLAAADAVTMPAYYDAGFDSAGYPTGGLKAHHLLEYDAQNRVVRDTISSSTYDEHSVQHVFYDDMGNTSIEWSTANASTPTDYQLRQIDTMHIQDENILTDIIYAEPINEYTSLKTNLPGVQSNPLYNGKLSTSIGCLGVFRGLGEYRSRNLPTWSRFEVPGSPMLEVNYVWTADASGRIVKGVGTTTGGVIAEIYTFKYSYN